MDESLAGITVAVIDAKTARAYTLRHHYMKTFPNPRVCFGVIHNNTLSGVLTFGHSPATAAKIKKILPGIKEGEYIEMQRMNLLDTLGANAESYVLGKVYELFKKNTDVKVILTHAGGCKNDCGIVYQSSAWLYFGKEPCNDFYLTDAGEYKNIIAPMRFGRVPKSVTSTNEEKGRFLFGPGHLIKSHRYLYLYPLNKGLRAVLSRTAQPYPKDSEHFRKGQQWVT